MRIECHLCGPGQSPISGVDGGHGYLQHLSRLHGVETPGRLFSRLLDPDTGCFTYKRLRAEHEDLYHDPLVNLNRQVLETAAAVIDHTKERKISCGGRVDERGKSPVAAGNWHLCIVCSRSFASSSEVQRHLLVEHVAAAAAAAGGETSSSPSTSSGVISEEAKRLITGQTSGDSDSNFPSNRKAI